ncbi:pyrroline-5-carboxylate reductase [Parashewanella spongiae]|uniref:Pyrroline-5-carboxylate reductase n=1 Tax=Parashewanella spongiae TaxID=342950 RepID=A0A3A6TLS0_9GAMM|nr:pyrroline-5-carboxylate reductase [Parashewanella spongiae]MCL1078308.1 pyrroline-5-carboxylate reductase [Parashewanella spongiae]RJY15041.1 pyrroline-5-carboxylate reductase [Parashewanella spongiae]
MTSRKICFIGSGNMARSIISGLVNGGYPANLIESTNPSAGKLTALQSEFGISVSHDNHQAAQNADVIVLAVKPQLMQAVCEHLQNIDVSSKLIITIAAGIPAKRYSDYLNQPINLIRTMPNTPTQIGVGVTGVFAPANITEPQKQLCQTIMATGGDVVWVEKESDLNNVIALAGSSPAYFFMFMESMIQVGEELGMPAESVRLMVQQAALGAAEMVKQNPQLSAAELRQNVTSKGGTTAEAIATFEKGGLRDLIESSMKNCIKKAEDMEKLF